MKVTDVGKVPKGAQNVSVVGAGQAGGGQGFLFSRHLMDFSQAQHQKYIEDLKDRIFRQGETIKRKADLGEFIQYRKLIAELLEVVAGNAYACARTTALDSRGRRNVFILIKKINVRLDELAQQILQEQKENLRLLEMVDEIRGLLLDILL
ncbi:MAG: YaaR family protein [Christensenellales bacterium]|jgi:uncharacterized protein YaaR (DUF327 family)